MSGQFELIVSMRVYKRLRNQISLTTFERKLKMAIESFLSILHLELIVLTVYLENLKLETLYYLCNMLREILWHF